MKQNIIIFIAFALLVACVSFLGDKLRNEKANSARLSQNLEFSLSNVKFYKTSAGDNAASVKVLTLEKKELKKLFPKAVHEAKAAGIKAGYIKAYSEIGTRTSVDVSTPVQDSFVVYRSRIDTLKCINYRDNWTTVIGCAFRDTFRGNIASFDTIIPILNRVPKKFLFIRHGTKYLKMDIISKNPHSTISFARHIAIQ